ncbi:MAG: hypothetical protein RIG77_20330 [Cyclobacteriaceae bacterium]
MANKEAISFETHGTSVLTRINPALNPEYFGIDERKMTDLMVFAMEFAKNVQFTNKENQHDGDWQDLFRNNISFLLARISCTDIDHFDRKFKKTTTSIDSEITLEEKKPQLKKLFEYTFELFELINHWYITAKSDLVHIEENKLVEQLQSAIGIKLRPQLVLFRRQVETLNSKLFSEAKTQFDYNKFDYIWADKPGDKPSKIAIDKSLEIKKIVKDVSVIHKTVFGVITYLKSISPKLLDQSITNYPNHSPHISLFLSFLKLFGHVQKDLNNILKRHLDYYYESLLKQSLRHAEPDHVHVYFEPAEHILKTNIPSGTLLAAGIDEEGLEYTYETDHNLELNQGVITDLKVVHVAKNPLIGVGDTYRAVSDIYARTINIDAAGYTLDDLGNPSSFDTFGKDQSDISVINRNMHQAVIGFAISSPILLLKEGDRNVNITYKFNLKSLSSLISLIEELTINENLSPEAAFYKIFTNIFVVSATAESGWFQTDHYEILPPKSWVDGEIQILLKFDIADPSIVPYDEELHGTGFSTQWPVLKFELSSENAMYAYSYLSDLIIEECKIDVTVNKVKDLHIFNDLGKLDTNKPFFPFGSNPDLGSYFLVGNEEVFRKNLRELSLDIHWHHLPQRKGGFDDHYKEYKQDIKTSSFTIGLTGLSGYQFHPVDKDNLQHLNLFEEVKNSGMLDNHLHLSDINLEKLKLAPSYSDMDLSDYNNQTKSGFLKLEVTGPNMGFGFAEYPRLFSEAIVENSKISSGILPSKDTKKVPVPNEPYSPQIRSISLNYSASTLLSMVAGQLNENDRESKDQIYHLHPFGIHSVFNNGLPQFNHLIPQFDDEGYLILGLEKIQAPVELSIYFELKDNVKNENTHAIVPQTKWSYLIGNDWVDFAENQLISDSTNNFTTSGIVRLKLPSEINLTHDILPSGKYWLSVKAKNNTRILSKAVFIKTNAVRATWKAHKPHEQWKENIPPKTINSFIETRADVNGVFQPFASFDGRTKETASDFYIRCSERLKHKNRAVTPQDYETLILDQFPFVFQAKCLTHFSHPEFVEKGVVKIIVVPKLKQGKDFYEPKVDYNHLQMIEEYLKSRASSLTDIEVINPVYEKVRISCGVQMRNAESSGEFIEHLETDLRKFICPWFDKNQREMDFGGSIERDDTHSFIESLDYVKFITKLSVVVLHYKEGEYSISDSASHEGEANRLTSSTPWSVLVLDSNHGIELMDKSIHAKPEETRIETMKIGSDFVIAEEEETEVEFPFFDLDKDSYYSIEIDL